MFHRPVVATACDVALLALLLLAPGASAAPAAVAWERWAAHDAASGLSVDHSAWDRLLREHVVRGADGVNRVRYTALRARAALGSYLEALGKVNVSRLPRDEQFAFWVNLYNALTVRVIVDHYPVESIRDIDISPGLFANGPWGKKLIAVEGEMVSLDDIEHRILRPLWKDPRIHYAVNCASIGCPDLAPTAFTAANVEALLDEGARAFVNHPRGARVSDGRLTVSSIYEWFKADFGDTDIGVIEHLRRHAEGALRDDLQSVTAIGGDGYDWSLNDAD